MAKKIKKSSKGKSSSDKAKTTKPKVLQIDFTGVEGRKRGRRVPEGDYLLKVTDYAKGGDDPGWIRIEHEIKKGPTKGEYSEMFSLSKKALFRWYNFLEAIGIKPKSGKNKIDMTKIVGKTYGATIGDNEYDNKTKSQIDEFYTKEEWEAIAAGDEEEESEDADLTSDDEDEDEDSDEVEEDEEDEDEEDEDEDDEDEDDEDDDDLEVVDDDDI